jgi:hypothetical protein
VLADHLFERALSPHAALNTLPDVSRECIVIEHVQVGVEQRQFFLGQTLGVVFADAPDVLSHRVDGPVEHHEFGGDVLGLSLRHAVQTGRRLNDDHPADRDPRGAGDAPQHEVLSVADATTGGIENAFDVAGGFGVRDDRGELGGQGDEESFFALVEAPHISLLHDQNAQHVPVVDNRHAEEGVERLFADFGHVVEAAMLAGILQVYRLSPLRNQGGQALIQSQG